MKNVLNNLMGVFYCKECGERIKDEKGTEFKDGWRCKTCAENYKKKKQKGGD